MNLSPLPFTQLLEAAALLPRTMAESLVVDHRAETQEHLDARTDLELIAAVNAGDAAAFEALYLRHRDWVLNLAHRFTGDADLALDVLQETFLYFLRKFPGFRLTANLKTFLYPAVRNLSIAARRKTQRLQSDESELDAIANETAIPIHVRRTCDGRIGS